jgi:hypothetical protein
MRESIEQQEAVKAWRDAAVADGWEIAPTYGNHEPVTSAASMTREGFKAMVLTRENLNPDLPKPICKFNVSAWAPDGIAIRVKFPYNWENIKAEVTTCPVCNRTSIPTIRVGFANRSCDECAPELRKRIERPGWTS